MRPLPQEHLDPRIKTVWRINDALWIVLCYLALWLPFFLIASFDAEEAWWAGTVCLVETGVLAAMLVVFLIVLPPIRYARWRYEVSPEYLDIAKGIVWRKRYIIPFIRVQNTDTRQGPILRAFGMASVTVSTAAGSHEIPGLDSANAEELRDRAAEFARIAREDV